MTPAIVAVVMSVLELLELWTGWHAPGIDAQWVETFLMVLAPLLVWLVPEWLVKRRAG